MSGTRDQLFFGGFAGLGYLPDQWRGALHFEADVQRGRFSVGLGQTLHPNFKGLYDPEANDLGDIARLIRYARINSTRDSRLYARLGPLQNVTLGSGSLVRRYRTTAAWDERRIGVEAAAEEEGFSAAGFVDNLRLDAVAGVEAELSTGLDVGPFSDVRIGASMVRDLGLRGDSSLTGIEARMRGSLIADGTFDVLPFVSFARLLDRGSSLGVGVDVEAPNISNAFRASAQAALFVSSSRFGTGHIGPFYAIDNQDEHIANATSFYEEPRQLARVGTPLDSMNSGADLVLDIRFVAFETYEVSQYVRRHFGGDKTSAYGLRLAARLRNGVRAEFALERQGFRGFLSLLRDLGEENQLILDVSAPIRPGIWFLVQSRYGYRALRDEERAGSPGNWFLVERRFQPMIGIRATL